jgi:hypothetical protein
MTNLEIQVQKDNSGSDQPTVFRIREILTRIWSQGSYHWITDPVPNPDPALFFSNFQDANKK